MRRGERSQGMRRADSGSIRRGAARREATATALLLSTLPSTSSVPARAVTRKFTLLDPPRTRFSSLQYASLKGSSS